MRRSRILVLLAAVVDAVAVVATRLRIPQRQPGAAMTGVVLALIPGLPTVELSPEFVLLLVFHRSFISPLLTWRGAVRVQSPPNHVACRWLCPIHDDSGCRCGPLAARIHLAGRFRVGRDAVRRQIPWRRFPLRVDWNFQGASSSFWKAKVWRMTPRPSFSIVSR